VAAIASEDVALLSKTPGIGKKTAERVVIELKDKLAAFRSGVHAAGIAPSSGAARAASVAAEDAELALIALGYKQADARKSVEKALAKLGPQASTEALLKLALG